MSILMVGQNAASTAKEAANMCNQSGYGLAVTGFVAFIILLFIALTPVNQNKGEL